MVRSSQQEYDIQEWNCSTLHHSGNSQIPIFKPSSASPNSQEPYNSEPIPTTFLLKRIQSFSMLVLFSSNQEKKMLKLIIKPPIDKDATLEQSLSSQTNKKPISSSSPRKSLYQKQPTSSNKSQIFERIFPPLIWTADLPPQATPNS